MMEFLHIFLSLMFAVAALGGFVLGFAGGIYLWAYLARNLGGYVATVLTTPYYCALIAGWALVNGATV